MVFSATIPPKAVASGYSHFVQETLCGGNITTTNAVVHKWSLGVFNKEIISTSSRGMETHMFSNEGAFRLASFGRMLNWSFIYQDRD